MSESRSGSARDSKNRFTVPTGSAVGESIPGCSGTLAIALRVEPAEEEADSVTDTREPKDPGIGQTASRAFEREERWWPSLNRVSEGARRPLLANRSIRPVNHHLQRLEVASTQPSRHGSTRRADGQPHVQTIKPARRTLDRLELVIRRIKKDPTHAHHPVTLF